MLTLTPNLYSAGLRPSLRAMSDSLFGGDLWHSHPGAGASAASPLALPAPPPLAQQLPCTAHRRADSNYSSRTDSRSHSRSSSYSSGQSSISQRARVGTAAMSPTLALARHSFHSPSSSVSTLAHTPASSISTVDAVNAWPPERGIEYVRATVTLSSPPKTRPRRAGPQSIAAAAAAPKAPSPPARGPEPERKGLQPLWLESKACRSPRLAPKAKALPATAPLERTQSRQSEPAEPESPSGLRPLLLAAKARPARSAEERARDQMGLNDRPARLPRSTTWHAEPGTAAMITPPPKAHLSFRERARRTIASIADIDW